MLLSIFASVSANKSGVDISIPWICASPVMPGRAWYTSSLFLSLINSCWLNKQGLGPTKLISPLSTFQSWGNSSNLVRRKKRPNGVIDDASARCEATEAVSATMVRNFTSTNACCPSPTRFCWKNGDRVSNQPRIMINKISGESNSNPTAESKKSHMRIISETNTILQFFWVHHPH